MSSRTNVLIVEDDPSARKAISTILRRKGFAVTEAATIGQAIIALHEEPHWLLLDLMLPDGCGIDILHYAKSHNLNPETIVITGCATHLLEDAQSAGAHHCFTKPLDIQRLMHILAA